MCLQEIQHYYSVPEQPCMDIFSARHSGLEILIVVTSARAVTHSVIQQTSIGRLRCASSYGPSCRTQAERAVTGVSSAHPGSGPRVGVAARPAHRLAAHAGSTPRVGVAAPPARAGPGPGVGVAVRGAGKLSGPASRGGAAARPPARRGGPAPRLAPERAPALRVT